MDRKDIYYWKCDRAAAGFTHQAVDSDLGNLRRRWQELVAMK